MKKFILKWKNKEIVIGKNKNVLVNQLIGINRKEDYTECLTKINMWEKEVERPDIITDVSTYDSELYHVWEYALEKGDYIVGTVPIYFVKDKSHLDKEELLSVIYTQLSKGVRIITIHPTPTHELIELAKNRIVPFTSRGGGIIIRDFIYNNRKRNIYLECLDEIISMCIEFGAAISIGTSFRAANIFDSMDEVQKREIRMQYEFADYIDSKGGNVIVEMPGHASPHKVEELNTMISDKKYPIMPLGPIVTDIGEGRDHITAAIGLTLMGMKGNVQVIAAVTAEEHTGEIPSKESTYEAVKTAKLVAHIIDMEQINDYSRDYQYATSRKESCIVDETGKSCLRCGAYCPLAQAKE